MGQGQARPNPEGEDGKVGTLTPAPSNERRWKIVYEPIGTQGESTAVVGEPLPQPQFTVGFGWFIYVYLSHGDWIFLAGLGAAAAEITLCGWLTPFVGPEACAIAYYIVVCWIISHTAPASGYCREFKWTYTAPPILAGVKDVPRSC